jgi:hypothetical protein
VDQVASELDQSFRLKIARWQRSGLKIDQWAWESYRIAAKTVYGKLPVRIPVESPQPITSCVDDNDVAARMLKLNEQIGQPYQDITAPVVEQQIAKAGARLAQVLNQIWAPTFRM